MNRIGPHQGVELHDNPQLAQAPHDNRVQEIAERAFGILGMLKAMVFLSGIGAVTTAILAPSALPFFLIAGGISVIALLILSSPSTQPVNLAANLETALSLELDLQRLLHNLGDDLGHNVITIEAFLDELERMPTSHWTERYQNGIRDIYLRALKYNLRCIEEASLSRKGLYISQAQINMGRFREYVQQGIEELVDFQEATQQLMNRRAQRRG